MKAIRQDDGQWKAEAKDDQLAFIRKAEREGFKVHLDYSGRGMYGRRCPAVVCAHGAFGFKGASMGRDIVVYLP